MYPSSTTTTDFFCFFVEQHLHKYLCFIIRILDGNVNFGGASRRVAGREDLPPHGAVSQTATAVSASSGNSAVTPSVKRWTPPSTQRKSAGSTADHNDAVFRRVRGILNKLTPEKFDKLSLELLNVGIDSQVVLKGIILLIFDKALDEPKYSSLYAQLCQRLSQDAPDFEQQPCNITTFRRLLLTKCQDEFENRSASTEAFEKSQPLTAEEEEACSIAKSKMLGNIKFIGELGKLDLLHEGILHKCIKQLLEKKKTEILDICEDLECLCQIMRTVGKILDHDKAKAWMDQYFKRIDIYMANTELPSRIRFMLQDVVELRACSWQPRRKQTREAAPRTIQEVRDEVAKEGGHFVPQRNVMPNPATFMLPPDPFFDSGLMMNGGGFVGHNDGPGPRMNDMFGKLQVSGYMGGNPWPDEQMGAAGGRHYDPSYNKTYNNDKRRTPRQNDSEYHNSGGHYNNDGRKMTNLSKYSEDEGRSLPPRFQKRQGGRGESEGEGGVDPGSNDVKPRPMTPGGLEVPGSKPYPAPYQHRSDNTQQYNNTAGGGQTGGFDKYNRGGSQSGGQGRGGPPPHYQNKVGGGGMSEGGEEVSLRPARNFTPSFRPNTPGMLPKSAQPTFPNRNVPQNFGGRPMGVEPNDVGGVAALNQNKVKVTQVPTLDKHKDKQQKTAAAAAAAVSNGASAAVPVSETFDLIKPNLDAIMKKLLEDGDVDEAVKSVMNLKSYKKFGAQIVEEVMIQGLQKSDGEQETCSKFLSSLTQNNALTTEQFIEGYSQILNRLNELETLNVLAKSHCARYGAHAVSSGVVSLVELSQPLRGGACYPLFMLCLQQLCSIRTNDWLSKIFHQSKINLTDMLPESNRDKLNDELENRGLDFLYPLLRYEAALWKQINADPNPINYYKWIKDNVDEMFFSDPHFITLLVTCVIKYVTRETTMKDGYDRSTAPDKTSTEAEKQLLLKYKGVLQKFLQDKIDLQVTSLYAIQVYAHDNSNPKGLVLRCFVTLYDADIIDEEAYLHWKEELNDLHPGKGTALFQVNQWLMWLEQAEEESEEEDD